MVNLITHRDFSGRVLHLRVVVLVLFAASDVFEPKNVAKPLLLAFTNWTKSVVQGPGMAVGDCSPR